MKNKIVMVGCHEAGWLSVKLLLEKGIQIAYFVSITREMAEVNKVSGYKSFDDLAEEYKIPIYYAKSYSLKDQSDVSFFESYKFDLLIQGGWQRLFPDEVLKTLRIGAVGVHGSSEFLPKGRGRSPINWTLIEGRKRFIMHYFLMKPGIDDGDVFHYEMFDINEWDDCNTLYYKNALLTDRVLASQIPKLLQNDYTVYKQEGIPSYYPKRTENDGRIDWNLDLFQIYNFIRALTKPYPGAFAYLNNVKIRIWKAQPFDTRIDTPEFKVGEICYIFNNDLIIKVNGGMLLISNYEIEQNTKILVGDQLQ